MPRRRSRNIADTSLDEIVRLMVGRELNEFFPRIPHTGDPLLEIRDLTSSAGRTT
jgi:rhamnose transport system ATP-binding protein